MVEGVTNGFEKRLQITGVGYRAKPAGQVRSSCRSASPIRSASRLRTGSSSTFPQPTEVIVRGIDKQLVGETAAQIRRHRPPEPYKGKGVRYADEQVRRKVGKRA